jgi:hypothetical protein
MRCFFTFETGLTICILYLEISRVFGVGESVNELRLVLENYAFRLLFSYFYE